MNPYSLYDLSFYKKIWHETYYSVRRHRLYSSCGISKFLPRRISVNQAGELALEEEQRTGKVDLYNPNIVDTSLWDGYMEDVPYACVEVNGNPMEFFAVFTRAIIKRYSSDGKYQNYDCLDGFYSKQGNNLRMLPKSSETIWLTDRWWRYGDYIYLQYGNVEDFFANNFDIVYTMEQWERNGGFKGRAEGQEISYEVYNRFFQENYPTQSLPSYMQMTININRPIHKMKTGTTVRLMGETLYGDRNYFFHSYYNGRMNIWDASTWEGFMTTEPCAYANINGKKRAFYMTFSKRKEKSGDFCYRFEGLYSKHGYDFFLLCGPILNKELMQERVHITEDSSCRRYCFDGNLKIDVSASGEKISQEISEEEYNRFLREYSIQPLPCRLPKDRDGEVNLELEEEYGKYCLLLEERRYNWNDISSWEGFMTTEPCAYAEVDGEQRPFYLAFSKRKDQYRGYFCRFEGVYSAQGDNIFCIPADRQTWISTEHIRWRDYVAPLRFKESDSKKIIINSKYTENTSEE